MANWSEHDWGDYDPQRADMDYIASRRMWASEIVPLMNGRGDSYNAGTWAGGDARTMLHGVDGAIAACVHNITGQTLRTVVVHQVTHSVFVNPIDGTPWLLVTVVAEYSESDKAKMRQKQRERDANKG